MIDLGVRDLSYFPNERVTLCVFRCGCSAWHHANGEVTLHLLVLCGYGHDTRPELWTFTPLHPRVGWKDGPP